MRRILASAALPTLGIDKRVNRRAVRRRSLARLRLARRLNPNIKKQATSSTNDLGNHRQHAKYKAEQRHSGMMIKPMDTKIKLFLEYSLSNKQSQKPDENTPDKSEPTDSSKCKSIATMCGKAQHVLIHDRCFPDPANTSHRCFGDPFARSTAHITARHTSSCRCWRKVTPN